MQCKSINHSGYEEPCKADVDLNACTAVEYKKKDGAHSVRSSVMIRKVGLCKKIKKGDGMKYQHTYSNQQIHQMLVHKSTRSSECC